MVIIADPVGLQNGEDLGDSIDFTRDGQTVIEGDSVVGGNTHTAGDSSVAGDQTVTGGLTAGGDSMIGTDSGSSVTVGDSAGAGNTTVHGTEVTVGGSNTDTVTIGNNAGSDINIGDATGGAGSSTTVSGDTITLGDTTTATTTVEGDMVNVGGGAGSTTDINSETVTVGAAGGTTTVEGALNVDQSSTFNQNVTITGSLDLENPTELTYDANAANDHTLAVDADGVVIRTNATNFSAVAGHVATWAEGNNTDTIPTAKLPNFVIGEVHVVDLPDASTTSAAGIPSIADLVAYLNTAAAAGEGTFHEGDTVIATGTTEGGTLADGSTITFLYVTAGDAGKTAGTGGGFLAADFHQIASNVAGVTSVIAGDNISVSGATGDVTIALDLDTSATGAILYEGADGLAGSNISQALDGTISISAATNVSGNTSIQGASTFTVGTGATSLGGTLGVTGPTTVGTFTATGESSLDGGIDVDEAGNSVFSVNGATGNTVIAGTLGVGSDAQFDTNLSVTGNTVLGAIESPDSPSNTTINGSLTVDSGFSITALGGATIGQTGNPTSILGNVTIGSIGADTDTVAINTDNLDINSQGEVTISSSSINGGANTFLAIAADGTVSSAIVDVQGSISGTAGTIPVYQEDGTGLEDSPVTTAPGAIAFNIDTALFTGSADIRFSEITGSDGTTIIGYQARLTGITGPSEAELNAAIGGSFTFGTLTGDQAPLSNTTWIIGSVIAGSGIINVPTQNLGVAALVGLDDVLGGVVPLAGSVTGNGPDGIAVSGPVNANAGLNVTGAATLTSLATTQTSENRNLVVTPGGAIAVGAGSGGGAGFSLVTATATNTQVPAGDLVILTPVATDSIILIPATSTPGDRIEIANFSTGMAGIWGIGGGAPTELSSRRATVIMGQTIADNDAFMMDDATASFTLVYTNATYGWVVIGAN